MKKIDLRILANLLVREFNLSDGTASWIQSCFTSEAGVGYSRAKFFAKSDIKLMTIGHTPYGLKLSLDRHTKHPLDIISKGDHIIITEKL